MQIGASESPIVNIGRRVLNEKDADTIDSLKADFSGETIFDRGSCNLFAKRDATGVSSKLIANISERRTTPMQAEWTFSNSETNDHTVSS